eukprot:916064-Rhodomonas_salina.1
MPKFIETLSDPAFDDIPCKVLTERLSYAPFIPGVTNKLEPLAFKFEESCAARDFVFGPVDVFAYRTFSSRLSDALDDKAKRDKHFVYWSKPDGLFVDNAVLLLAAYMVLEKKWSSRNALRPFLVLEDDARLRFRHTPQGQPAMELSVKDCICGIEKAQAKGWLADFLAEDGALLSVRKACNKFVGIPIITSAIRRHADLKSSDVTVYIRARQRSQLKGLTVAELKAQGVQCLSFCAGEKPTLVDFDKFFEMCDAQRGVAFEGSLADELPALLICAWLVKRHAFTASEAIGFMLFLLPGSILGPQERLLKRFEATLSSQTPLATRLSSDTSRLSSLGARRRSSTGEAGLSSDDFLRLCSEGVSRLGSDAKEQVKSDDFSRSSTLDRATSHAAQESNENSSDEKLRGDRMPSQRREDQGQRSVQVPKADSGVEKGTSNL